MISFPAQSVPVIVTEVSSCPTTSAVVSETLATVVVAVVVIVN